MKTIKLKLLLIISVFAFMISCGDDDSINVDSTPEFQSFVSEISSLPGQIFTFEGVLSDPAGIKSININYEPWFLEQISELVKIEADIIENGLSEDKEDILFFLPRLLEEGLEMLGIAVFNCSLWREILNKKIYLIITPSEDLMK